MTVCEGRGQRLPNNAFALRCRKAPKCSNWSIFACKTCIFWLCGKSSFHLVGTVRALYNIILKVTNIILFLSQVLAYSRASVAHFKEKNQALYGAIYIGMQRPSLCQMGHRRHFLHCNSPLPTIRVFMPWIHNHYHPPSLPEDPYT